MTTPSHPNQNPPHNPASLSQPRTLPPRRALPRPHERLFWVICKEQTAEGHWTFHTTAPDSSSIWTELTYGPTDQSLGPALDPFAVAAPDQPALAMLLTTADQTIRPILLPLERAVVAIDAQDSHPAFLTQKLLAGNHITLTPQIHEGINTLRIDAQPGGNGQTADRQIEAWVNVAAESPVHSRILIDDRDWRGFAIQAAIGSGVGTPDDLNEGDLLGWDQAMGLIMHIGQAKTAGDVAVTPEAGHRFALFVDCANHGQLFLVRTEAVLQVPQQVRITARTFGPSRNQPTHTLNP